MATSGASSSTGSRGASGQAGAPAQPLCPFCRTPTVVERTSRTLKNPDKLFYTCKNRDWGSNKCNFFMWKPVSDGIDEGTLMAGFQALENSVLLLSNAVEALSVDVRGVAGQQILNRWLIVASLIVGVVLCIFMYYKA